MRNERFSRRWRNEVLGPKQRKEEEERVVIRLVGGPREGTLLVRQGLPAVVTVQRDVYTKGGKQNNEGQWLYNYKEDSK